MSENSVKIPQYAIEYDADKLTPTVQGSQSFPVTKKVDTQGYPKQEVQLCDTSIHVPLYCFLEDIIVKKIVILMLLRYWLLCSSSCLLTKRK